MPAGAHPASTVLVVRDTADGVAVYLQRRPPTMQFAGGLWVFPGGRVDATDQDPRIDGCWRGPPPAVWAATMGVPEPAARAHVVAAYRETLEEAGILLARDGPSPSEVAEARRALLAGTHTFADVARGLALRLDTSLLRYWAWWVTPAAEPRRYDTRFFLARLPAAAAITPYDDEVIEETWATAATGGVHTMLPPTYYTLRDAVAYPSVAAAMRDRRAIARTEPTLDHGRIVLPWGERYDPRTGPVTGT